MGDSSHPPPPFTPPLATRCRHGPTGGKYCGPGLSLPRLMIVTRVPLSENELSALSRPAEVSNPTLPPAISQVTRSKRWEG